MTPKEKVQLEKDYPQFNVPRLVNALTICGIIMLIAWIFI